MAQCFATEICLSTLCDSVAAAQAGGDMSRHKTRLLFAALLAVVAATSPAAAQTKPKIVETGIARPSSVIFIGNSFFYYNNSLHNHFARLIRAADAGYRL